MALDPETVDSTALDPKTDDSDDSGPRKKIHLLLQVRPS
jgi:hypothetical protein